MLADGAFQNAACLVEIVHAAKSLGEAHFSGAIVRGKLQCLLVVRDGIGIALCFRQCTSQLNSQFCVARREFHSIGIQGRSLWPVAACRRSLSILLLRSCLRNAGILRKRTTRSDEWAHPRKQKRCQSVCEGVPTWCSARRRKSHARIITSAIDANFLVALSPLIFVRKNRLFA